MSSNILKKLLVKSMYDTYFSIVFPNDYMFLFQTHRQPISEYEIIREKAATQKRDTERALTKFIAKTGPTNSLFPDDGSLFPRKYKPAVQSHVCACFPITNLHNL